MQKSFGFSGFVDIQVNGRQGIDFNYPDYLYSEAVEYLCELQLKGGVVRFCPTIVSNSDEVIKAILSRIKEARQTKKYVAETIPGVHLETYVSPEAAGCHNKSFLRRPDWRFIDDLGDLGDLIKIITIAPELPGAIEFIRKAVAAGIKVSIGHTMADHKTIVAACQSGALCGTHVGNGIPSMIPRNDNPINSLLSLEFLWATFIADFHHIPAHILKHYIRRAKGVGRSIIITDSIAAAGMGDGSYELAGQPIAVKDDRACMATDERSLAGSVITMLQSAHNLEAMGFTPEEVVCLTSLNPASFLGISDSMRDALVVVDVGESDGAFKVEKVSISGRSIV